MEVEVVGRLVGVCMLRKSGESGWWSESEEEMGRGRGLYWRERGRRPVPEREVIVRPVRESKPSVRGFG